MDFFKQNVTDPQTMINQIMLEFMREQKRKRRYRWLMRIVILLLIGVSLFNAVSLYQEELHARTQAHAGIIDISGEIAADGPVSADDLAKSMDEAYKNTHMKALILRINSPGGSPVQADYIFQHIRYYEKKYPSIPVYAVCMDICASAAYYIASAAKDVYANPASMVGSIGVLFNGFGFVDLMQKVGVQRRLFTAGKNKGFLDPFTPLDPAQVPYLQSMLDQVHQIFISRVEEGRGQRLVKNPDLYSGLIWSGTQAKSLGLIDGFYSTGQLVRDKLKLEQIIDYSYKKSMLDKFSKNLSSQSFDPRHLLSYSENYLK